MGGLGEICTYFISTKRNLILKSELGNSKHLPLQKYCETRWLERHEAVTVFFDALSEISGASDKIVSSGADESGKAISFQKAVFNFVFLLTLNIMERMLVSVTSFRNI